MPHLELVAPVSDDAEIADDVQPPWMANLGDQLVAVSRQRLALEQLEVARLRVEVERAAVEVDQRAWAREARIDEVMRSALVAVPTDALAIVGSHLRARLDAVPAGGQILTKSRK